MTGRRPFGRRVAGGLALLGALTGAAAGVSAQQPAPGAGANPPGTPSGVPLADSAEVTPGGAFLRSAVVPGWGHAVTESYGRAGFYVATQTGSLWMLLQTISRHSIAEDMLRVARKVAREVALASIEPVPRPPDDSEDPAAKQAYSDYLTAIEVAIDSDASVEQRTALVDARDQQVEDWAALSIFLVLLGATDAFVAAHLADYPEPLSFDVAPGRSGGAELSFSLPVGSGR